MNQLKGKKSVVVGIVIFAALVCNAPPIQADESGINIVCTNSMLADFTEYLLENTTNITVEYIMPAGVCPAHFDTSPSDVALITSADIIISLGWEPWLDDLLESSGNTDYKEIRCSHLGEWNIPSGAKEYVEKLTTGLSIIIPELNDTLQANSQEYVSLINETAEQLKNMITNEGYQGRKVICMQWQSEFATWLGLNVVCSYAPPERLSTLDMLNVSNAAQSEGVCAIIDNLQSGTDFGARIASESGATHVIFTNFPGAISGTDSYIDMITYNTEQIVNGISTFDYKQGEIVHLERDISSLELQRNISLSGAFTLGAIAVILFILYRKK
ncbi:MAG: metal ABC transporter substrate-binding protein [Candidatus Thermoplasmatota archaeon]|nr:metal ABC transporter substrate-binding protein [Candidatus Thermoplasmatota archaeon]